ncbi:hypothetical protein MRX96_021423 [Rhipicephalus microplus]
MRALICWRREGGSRREKREREKGGPNHRAHWRTQFLTGEAGGAPWWRANGRGPQKKEHVARSGCPPGLLSQSSSGVGAVLVTRACEEEYRVEQLPSGGLREDASRLPASGLDSSRGSPEEGNRLLVKLKCSDLGSQPDDSEVRDKSNATSPQTPPPGMLADRMADGVAMVNKACNDVQHVYREITSDQHHDRQGLYSPSMSVFEDESYFGQ